MVVPFDQIIAAVERGEYEGQPIEAGLIIHEGQLTYADRDLKLVVDLGQWWMAETGLPLPLGANALRKDLGPRPLATSTACCGKAFGTDWSIARKPWPTP